MFQITKKKTRILFFSFIVANVLFQLSIHQDIVNMVSRTIDEASGQLSDNVLVSIVISIQFLSVFIAIISIIVNSLVIWFFSFLLGSKIMRKEYFSIIVMAYSVITLRILLLTFINIFVKSNSIIALSLENKWILWLDPFLWTSIFYLYFILSESGDLSRRKSIAITLVFSFLMLVGNFIFQFKII